jgi:hypothetical protein
LQRENLIRPDGVPTDAGRAAAAKVSRDERRWEIARQIHQDAGLTGRYDGLTPIEDVFTADEIRDFDRRIGPPVPVEGHRWAEFVQFSLTPILIGILASVACALPGNFLILRRQALIGDAISHVVLPGHRRRPSC